ncbi:MAG: zinc finger and SCAN domain containing 10 [Bogoriella megaspora]|nr:MAG: zinc finger and SCAN domain containing 10 [Bogoriella megaspora]
MERMERTFSALPGSDFYEQDEHAFLEPRDGGPTNSHLNPHCDQCWCIDPRCLQINCPDCIEPPAECQQCVDECPENCTEGQDFVVDCNGGGACEYLQDLVSPPCNEPCQNTGEASGCSGCQAQLPRDYTVDTCCYGPLTDQAEIQRPINTNLQAQITNEQAQNTFLYNNGYPGDSTVFLGTPFLNVGFPDDSFGHLPCSTDALTQYRVPEALVDFGKRPTSAQPALPLESQQWQIPMRKSPQRPSKQGRHKRRPSKTKLPDLTSGAEDEDEDEDDLDDEAEISDNSLSKPSTPSKIRTCLWYDPSTMSSPCNATFTCPVDLHKHLMATHSTTSDVHCRWVGCRSSIHSTTGPPHRFAAGVQRHTWGHSGYRPYICSICKKGFAAANVLAEHKANIHEKQKKFLCDHCGHRCTSASNLKRHIGEKHEELRFQCEWCARNGKVKCFRRGPNLARHFRRCKFVIEAMRGGVVGDGKKGGMMGVGKEMKKGKMESMGDSEWFPPGYRKGKCGMDRSKVLPTALMGQDFGEAPR